MRATGTITPRSRADIRSSSATRRTGRRWATGAWPGINRRRSGSTTGPVTFVDVAQIVGATDRHDGRSVALADFGGRGVLDVVVANQRGPLLLYTNQVSPERQVDRVRAGGWVPRGRHREVVQQPQRDRRAGRALLERAAAAPGSVRRLRFLRTESAAIAFRPGHATGSRSCRHSLAVRQDAGTEGARRADACTTSRSRHDGRTCAAWLPPLGRRLVRGSTNATWPRSW